MKNILLILLTFSLQAEILIPQSSKQLLLVTSQDFNSSKALLQAYERKDKNWSKVFKPISVNLGRNGLGWGEGEVDFPHKESEPLKYEGDGKAPAGIFTLDSFFGYEKMEFNFPYIQVGSSDICVDDSDSRAYNQLIKTTHTQPYKSFEFMRREDGLYELGIMVGHNKKGLKKRGSCIFIHIQRDINSPTSGCTSLPKIELLKLMKWLDYSKQPLLLQLPYEKEVF